MSGTVSLFVGTALGRSLLSRPRRRTIWSDQVGSPNGHPQATECRRAANSASVPSEDRHPRMGCSFRSSHARSLSNTSILSKQRFLTPFSSKLPSPLPIPQPATRVGNCYNHNGVMHQPIHDAVGILSQKVLAMPSVAEWPSLGSLNDVIERSLNRFLEPFCRAFASLIIPTTSIFVVAGRGWQESHFRHGTFVFVEPDL